MERRAVIEASLQRLASLIENDDKLWAIDNGGCAYFATYLKAYLEGLGEETHYVLLDRHYGYAEDEWYDMLKSNESTSCSHVLLEWNGFYVDREGLHTEDEVWNNWGSPLDYCFSFNRLEVDYRLYFDSALARNRDSWNTSWNYRKNNRRLLRYMNNVFYKAYNALGKGDKYSDVFLTVNQMI